MLVLQSHCILSCSLKERLYIFDKTEASPLHVIYVPCCLAFDLI